LLLRIGDFFMRVPDYQRALQIYQEALKLERHNPDALTKAGRAAFELGQYQLAERYLTSASAAKPNDPDIANLLKMSKTIPTLDPYNFYSSAKRDRIVLSDFDTAGERLNACLNSTAQNPAATSPLQPLYAQWMDMKTRLNGQSLRAHPELMDPAMNLVFNIERETSNLCSNPVGDDLLLLLIGRNHQGG
jgi:tetratricopeptide (TPR) repeat protein